MESGQYLKVLYAMLLIRKVELEIANRYSSGKMRCPTHLSIGQEAAAVGVASAFVAGDLAVSTHRSHAHYLAMGGDLRRMLAEIYGKVAGCSRGRGGSMHLIDKSVGFRGSTAIVGNSIPIGVGLAMSLKIKRSEQVATIFLGDGCVEEGVFYESVNFAVVKKLPVLFVCENNLYSVYSPLSVRQPGGRRIFEMVKGVGLPALSVDGNDVVAVREQTHNALAFIRSGGGPYFMELPTYRWLEHCGPNFDDHLGYRPASEVDYWRTRDPVSNFTERLTRLGILSKLDLAGINSEIDKQIEAAFRYADECAFPESSEAFTDEYSVQ
jgi:TPP-dependent pyruvate/acetoin dehydrogenase alpha subunit